jgi:site-specific recombinase XerD
MINRQKRRKSRQAWKRHIQQFCDVWLRAINRSRKTIRAYRTDLNQFARHLPLSVTPGRVDRNTIEKWIAHLQQKEYAASSIRRKLACLRVFFGYMVDQRRVSTSPLRDIRIRLGAVKRLTRVVQRSDVRAIVQTVDHQANERKTRRLSTIRRLLRLRDALLVRLLCVTGIRVGELVSIRTSNVMQIDRALVIHGKGNRERLAFIADQRTACVLDRYLKVRRAHFVDCDSLFTNAAGAQLSTDSARSILRAIGREAGASCRVTPHMLRHTAATALLENGADLRIVQEFLGHDSIRSTERYTHIAQGHLLRVLRRANPLRYVA